MRSARRFQRYPINLRLTLALATGQLETTTEEVSEEGFSAPCPQLPETAGGLPFTVQLPDGERLAGVARLLRPGGPGAPAGFSCAFTPEASARWLALLEQEHVSGGLWRMIGRYAASGADDHAAARTVVEPGRGGVLRLHMVGENGEAYRVAFTRHAPIGVDAALAGAPPHTLEVARRVIRHALPADVLLKRAPHAPVVSARVVELQRGGYGFIEHAGGQVGVTGLQGAELIGVEADGAPLFPFFTPEELQRIAADHFREASPENERPYAAGKPPVPPTPPPAPEPGRRLLTPRLLSEAMDRSERVQMRVYASRVLRLFPDVWLEVQRAGWGAPARGFALQDGERLCLFMLHGPEAPRVVQLQPGDAVFGVPTLQR